MKKPNVRTLSLIVGTFTYLLIGAAIFNSLESQKEESIRHDLQVSEDKYKYRYNITNYDYKTLEDIVIKYHPYRTFPQWKFTGAFYFSLTVITTIGYGHSTPQTILGKSFCMIYAMVGIPLCLVMFQSVGERLNYFGSFCIQLVKKCIRFRNTEVNQTEMVCVTCGIAVFVITGGAAMFSHYEGWTFFNSFYYCVITLTTIGFGDYVALQDKNNLSNISYVILSFTFILFGLTVVASSINLLVLKFLTMNTDDERREEFTKKSQNLDQITLNNGTANGQLMSEANELEDLKKENNIRTCFSSKSFHENFPCILFKYKSNIRNNCSSNSFSSKEPSFYELQKLEGTPSSGNNGAKKKKAHYTIRRAPGKIAHLLMQPKDINNSQDSPKLYFSETSSQYELQGSTINTESKITTGFSGIANQNPNNSKRTSTLSQIEIRNGLDTKRERFLNFFKHKKVTKRDETVNVFLKKNQDNI